MGIARNISGNKPPLRARSNKTINEDRKKGMEKCSGSQSNKKRVNKKYAIEAAVNSKRPVAALKGYFTPQNETYCKTYSPEELETLNKERGTSEDITLNLFSFEEKQKMARDGYKKDEWLDKNLKYFSLTKMSKKHIESCLLFLAVKPKRKAYGLGKKWRRKFANELAHRKEKPT